MQERRKEPMRTCVGCRRTERASLLARVAVVDGRVTPVVRFGGPGRTAWLCRRSNCVIAACRKGALARALRTDFARPDPEKLWQAVAQAGYGRHVQTPAGSGGIVAEPTPIQERSVLSERQQA